MKNPFTHHPAEVNETYTQHMAHASGFGFRMVWAGMACLVHAVFPFLCIKTGSRTIDLLHDRMITNRANLTKGSAPVASGVEAADAQRQ